MPNYHVQVVFVVGVGLKQCGGKKGVDIGSDDPWQNSGSGAGHTKEQPPHFSGLPPASGHQTTTNPVANAAPSWGTPQLGPGAAVAVATAPNPVFAPAPAAANPWGALDIEDSGGGASF